MSEPQPAGSFKKTSFYVPPDVVACECGHPLLAGLMPTWVGLYTKAQAIWCSRGHCRITCWSIARKRAGWLTLEGRNWQIRKGEVFLCPPGVPHSYGADERSPWTKYWVHFRGEQVPAYATLLGLSVTQPVLAVGEDANLISWFLDMQTVLRNGLSQASLLCAATLLARILAQMNALAEEQKRMVSQGLNMEAMMVFLRDHMDGRLPLSQMAAHAGLSKYHFSRRFKQQTGYAPVEFHIRLRLQKACELWSPPPPASRILRRHSGSAAPIISLPPSRA
jgi:AraC-like DNA-binding protein